MTKLYGLLGRLIYWLIWPGTWLYLRWSQRTRVIVLYRGEMLVVTKWLSNGLYHLPGGGILPDESSAKGAVRELYEETGITLHEDEVELLVSETYQHAGFRFMCHYYVFRASSRPIVNRRWMEIIDSNWLSRQDLSSDTCSPEVIRAFELLRAAERATR
jgi:8-oxo-dGTP pyrophosphatase MutT (NUDIX family)